MKTCFFKRHTLPFFQYVVLIDVPKDIRIKRVKNRSFQKFGNRMLAGGDLYEKENVFWILSSPEMRILLKSGCNL